jgi:hypothetical protein
VASGECGEDRAKIDGDDGEQAGKVYEALGAGALDAVNTPIVGMQGNHDGGGALLYKIETIGKLVGEPPSKEFSAALPFESKTEFIHRDLLIAIGMRFDDRVTGKISGFAPNAKVIHIDIDPAEIGKNVTTVQGDVANLDDLDRLYLTVKDEKGAIDMIMLCLRNRRKRLRIQSV